MTLEKFELVLGAMVSMGVAGACQDTIAGRCLDTCQGAPSAVPSLRARPRVQATPRLVLVLCYCTGLYRGQRANMAVSSCQPLNGRLLMGALDVPSCGSRLIATDSTPAKKYWRLHMLSRLPQCV